MTQLDQVQKSGAAASDLWLRPNIPNRGPPCATQLYVRLSRPSQICRVLYEACVATMRLLLFSSQATGFSNTHMGLVLDKFRLCSLFLRQFAV